MSGLHVLELLKLLEVEVEHLILESCINFYIYLKIGDEFWI